MTINIVDDVEGWGPSDIDKEKSENKSINLNKNFHCDEQGPKNASESGSESTSWQYWWSTHLSVA